MKKHSGFTLIEIMVSLLVGLIIVSATIAVYIATLKGSADTVKSARLNHDLESAISLMTNDLRRAGHWGGATAGSDAKENPFSVAAGETTAANFAPSDVTVTDFTDDGGTVRTNGCILYSYDADGDGHYDNDSNGAFDASDDKNEFYGFRFNVSASGSGVIEIRKTGTTTTDCTDGTWEAINVTAGGEAVEITDLRFSLATSQGLNISDNACVPGYYLPYTCPAAAPVCTATAPGPGDKVVISREVGVRLVARLVNDHSVTRKMTSDGNCDGDDTDPEDVGMKIKIRNDRHYSIP